MIPALYSIPARVISSGAYSAFLPTIDVASSPAMAGLFQR
jgi:hypothetical protein